MNAALLYSIGIKAVKFQSIIEAEKVKVGYLLRHVPEKICVDILNDIYSTTVFRY